MLKEEFKIGDTVQVTLSKIEFVSVIDDITYHKSDNNMVEEPDYVKYWVYNKHDGYNYYAYENQISKPDYTAFYITMFLCFGLPILFCVAMIIREII